MRGLISRVHAQVSEGLFVKHTIQLRSQRDYSLTEDSSPANVRVYTGASRTVPVNRLSFAETLRAERFDRRTQ
jgi:hypothetical protein